MAQLGDVMELNPYRNTLPCALVRFLMFIGVCRKRASKTELCSCLLKKHEMFFFFVRNVSHLLYVPPG